jgi:nitrite reductase/ring-hydroxylating ferredoxin subunit
MGLKHIPVGRPEEIDLEKGTPVVVEGRTMLVTRVNDTWVAFENACPHHGWEVYVSDIKNERLLCPGHNYSFDVKSGECMSPPWGPPLDVLPVEEIDGQVCIRLEW